MNFGDRLAALGGGDLEVLRGSSGVTRQRFVQTGLVLLGTATVSGAAMWFALYDAVLAPVPGDQRSGWVAPLAAFVALAWAALILNLDRLLIITMSSGSVLKVLALAAPRLLLALLIGAVVATPLTLRLFQSDIDFLLGQAAVDTSKANSEKIAASREQERVNKLTAEIAAQRKILTGDVGRIDDSSEVVALQRELKSLKVDQKQLRHDAEQADLLVNCELYGNGRSKLDNPDKCAAKPGPNGNYPKYLRDQQAADRDLTAINRKVSSKQAEIDSARASQQSQVRADTEQQKKEAPARIEKLEADLVQANNALAAFSQRLTRENNGNNGLLARLQALDEATRGSDALRQAHRAIFWLFASIELLPVLTKVLGAFGPKTPYDEALGLRDSSEVDAARIHRASKQENEANLERIEEGKRAARLAVQNDARRLEEKLGRESNQQVADVIREVMNETLASWKEAVRAERRKAATETDLRDYSSTGANPSSHINHAPPEPRKKSSSDILPPPDSLPGNSLP